jgi:flagellar assembly factor FliW
MTYVEYTAHHAAAGSDMRFRTTRFGTLKIDSEGILLFPEGLVGHDRLRHFVLLSESNNPVVGWLQSLNRADFAVAVVAPQHFVENYTLKLHRSQLSALPWAPTDPAVVLVIASRHDDHFTLNLKAPIVINLDRCLGRQVVTADDQPIRHVLSAQPEILRKIA